MTDPIHRALFSPQPRHLNSSPHRNARHENNRCHLSKSPSLVPVPDSVLLSLPWGSVFPAVALPYLFPGATLPLTEACAHRSPCLVTAPHLDPRAMATRLGLGQSSYLIRSPFKFQMTSSRLAGELKCAFSPHHIPTPYSHRQLDSGKGRTDRDRARDSRQGETEWRKDKAQENEGRRRRRETETQ